VIELKAVRREPAIIPGRPPVASRNFGVAGLWRSGTTMGWVLGPPPGRPFPRNESRKPKSLAETRRAAIARNLNLFSSANFTVVPWSTGKPNGSRSRILFRFSLRRQNRCAW